MKEKKQWQKPALIVLVRSKPEEAVLDVCKTTAGRLGWWCTHGQCENRECAPS